MADHDAAELVPLVSHEQMNNAFHRAIGMFVGRGKRHKASDVSVGAGVHRRTLDSYRGYPIGHPDHRPLDMGQMFSIASYCGADLTTAWLSATIGQAAYDLPDVEPDPGALAADTSDDSAKVVRMAIDGQFDGKEKSDCRAVGARMMSRGAQLIAVAAR